MDLGGRSSSKLLVDAGDPESLIDGKILVCEQRFKGLPERCILTVPLRKTRMITIGRSF
jgi:hypothetical protein